MPERETVYCELCGRLIQGRSYKAVVENVLLTLCEQCYRRVQVRKRSSSSEILMDTRIHTPIQQRVDSRSITRTKPSTTTSKLPMTSAGKRKMNNRELRRYLENYDVVENYSEIIKKARERMGWTQAVLAEKLRVQENVVRRIESGRLKPPIELALRIEKLLKVKILEPIVDEYSGFSSHGKSSSMDLTLGDIVNIRNKQKQR